MRPTTLIFALTAALGILTALAAPAAAFDSYSSLCADGSFNRCPYAPSTPLMDKQIDCVHCVASATQTWIDFARIRSGANNRPSQSDVWSYAASTHGLWNLGAPYNTDWITRQYNQSPPTSCATYAGNRRAINVSLDDGIDPYGEGWVMWANTPGGYYYHQYVFDTGPTMNGREFASHSMAWALRTYTEPVGVNIGNGGHFVLVTYVNTVADPASDYYTPIASVAYRDPLRDLGYQRVQLNWTDWWNALTPYGYNGESAASAPNCHNPGNDPNRSDGNCQDETHYGPNAGNLWWHRWVLIERDVDSGTADSVHGVFSR